MEKFIGKGKHTIKVRNHPRTKLVVRLKNKKRKQKKNKKKNKRKKKTREKQKKQKKNKRKRKATKMEFCSGLSNIPQGNLLMGGPGKPNSFKGT